ncbi:MAG: histidine kinase [Ignavibacteriales bacterium]|nr:histidine kinase [Ignavibacteriales bacterium]
MLKKYHFLLFVLFLSSLNAQISVRFEVTVNDVADSEAVYIVGNHPGLGGWNPSKIKMSKENEILWKYTLNLERKGTLEYKFTKGNWNNEAVGPDGIKKPNFVTSVTSDTTIKISLCCWGKMTGSEFKGQITGNVEYIRNLGEGEILPRDVIILLPDGYDKSNHHYPVLYMHDGQNIFDPSTVGFGVDWQVDEALDSLNRQGVVKDMIVVGINNSVNRSAEYSHSPLGAAYMKFVTQKVKPLIDSLYRTKPGREFTWTAGSSMGGLISFMLLWEYNDIFSIAGSFSPAFKIAEFDYVSIVKKTSQPKRNFKLYIDNGGMGLEALLQPGIDKMISTLEELGYKRDSDFFVTIDPEAEHNEAAWAKRIPNFLMKMFGK